MKFLKDVTYEVEGKASNPGTVYSDYSNDAWASKNTCLISSPCQQDSSWLDTTGCELRWDTILYKAVDAKRKDKTYEKDTLNDNSSNDKTKQELGEGPVLGDSLIIVAWVAVVLAGGYTVYYFRQKKKETI